MNITEVKKQIKEWEYSFVKSNGKPPTKVDIKSNSHVDKLYKTYKKLKQKTAVSTPTKRHGKGALIDSIKDFFEEELDPDEYDTNLVKRNTELGPTPQGGGKVLSIFDIIKTPPESSPLIKKPSIPTNEFKTPTKLKPIDLNINQSGTSSIMQKLANAAKSPVKTPTKSIDPVHETPSYLNRNIQKFDFSQNSKKDVSPFDPQPHSSPINTPENRSIIDFQVSPSPFFQRSNKSLLDVFHAHQNISISKEEEEEYDIGEEESDHEPIASTSPSRKRKSKTQKRTTRNWKMKPIAKNKDNGMASKDLHLVMEEIRERQEATLDKMTRESASEEEEEEEEEEIKPTKKVRMIAPVSNNYKRMKIHYKKNKNWGKRR